MVTLSNFRKRILSLAICVLVLFNIIVPAAAMSINSGISALRGQWSRAEGPVAGGMSLEYSYFVPASDKPCPLIVLLGGAGEGTPSGQELKANNFANWSSDEYQSRAAGGGMYILILKAPEPVYFDTCPLAPMFAAIKDFAAKHNVDKKRVYAGGWCIGASGASRLATNHPDFFAGVMLFSQRTIITEHEAKIMKNMRIWIVGCNGDTYSPYYTYGYPSWQNIVKCTADKSNVRCTTCSTAPRADLLFNHETWRLAEFDFSSYVLGDYTGLETVDGNGSRISSPTMISFMTAYRAGEAPPETETETETETEAETETAAETTGSETQAAETTAEVSTEKRETVPEEQNSRLQKPLVLLIAVCATALIAGGFVIVEKRKKRG